MSIYTRKRTFKPPSPTQLPSPPPSDPLAPTTPASDPISSPLLTTAIITSRAPHAAGPPSKNRRKLTQTRLDLGGPAHTRCAACGMEYARACAEDAALHRRFHAAALGGLAVPRTVLLDASLRCRRYPRLDQRGGTSGRNAEPASAVDRVVCVGRRDGRAARAWAQRTLAFVEGELGAVATSAAALWGASGAAGWHHDDNDGGGCSNGKTSTTTRKHAATVDSNPDDDDDDDAHDDIDEPDKENAAAAAPQQQQRDRFRVHLYVRDGKCIGLLLAESITRARQVLPPLPPPPPRDDCGAGTPAQPPPPPLLRVEDEARAVAAAVGVSRIWVSREWRRSGVATRLLGVAGTGGGGVGGIAFSQPTQAGAALARRWFGREAGWLVY